jgi:signal transduction histidine kinase/FixJ family two-component response regulator/HPt (histidine-containing phosphotransfer) domain-containing protein
METSEKPVSSGNSRPALTSSVLVVSADRALPSGLAASLVPQGIMVRGANSEAEMLQLVPDGNFDLIVYDCPASSILVDAIQHLFRRSRVALIVLAEDASTLEKFETLDVYNYDYLLKPCDPADLAVRIRTGLRRKDQIDALLQSNEELKAARAAAEESARGKAEFLANMSHEIRTPMNGVIAMTALLLQTQLHHEQRDFVETIRSSGESLLTIINDILNFSKIQSGKLELEHRPVDLRACVEEVLDLLATKAAEKNLTLYYDFEPSTPEFVMGDVTRLRQILVNLISNAIKFTSAGDVSVHVRANPLRKPPHKANVPNADSHPSEVRTNGWFEVQFSVRDTGIGIPAEKLHKLFQSFSQMESSTTREYGGTGLGLAISKGLVELKGGEMWVESSPGSGSVFHFKVPFPRIATLETRDLNSAHPRLKGLRALIAEPNAAVRGLLLRYTSSWGMQISETSNRSSAIELLRCGQRFDALLIELSTSASDDFTNLASDLRKQAGQAPLILLTTRTVHSEHLPARTQFIAKPLKPQSLRTALLQVIDGGQPAARSEAAAVPKLDNSLAGRLPLRILVADDNLVNQKVASRLLQQMGYKADVANNGLEVLQALDRKPYDVILMDVQMPRMDGLEATRQIRSRQAEPVPRPHFDQPIMIIAMTANAMHGDREKCVGAGMNDYVPKPVRPEALQTALEKFPTLSSGQTASKTPNSDSAFVIANPPALALEQAVPSVAPAVPVDLNRLMEFSGGFPDSFGELVALYLKQTTEQLQELQVAYSERQCDRIAALAHSCAGASATCGMVGLVPLLRRLEQSAMNDDLAASAPLVRAVHEEFHRIKLFLDSHPKLLSAA